MDQPSIFRKNLWLEQQERLMDLFALALSLLEQGESLPEGPEPEITRRLAICCHRAEYRMDREGRGISGNLHWETKDLQQYMDLSIPVRETKAPDCQYEFQDQQASDYGNFRKSLTIECKRLGRFHSSHTRQLNQKYVQDGICRFLDEGHSYGRLAPCGIMIGYVQNMRFDEILKEVNAECCTKRITELVLSNEGWQPGFASHLNHRFDRSFPLTPFALRHIWADLRRHYRPRPN